MMPDAIDMDMYRQKRSLKDGNGDGTFDGMEARVARLESDVAHLVKQVDKIDARLCVVEGDVGTIKIDVAVLKERVSHLPTKGWMVNIMVIALTIIGTLIAFAEKIQALVG